MTIRPARAPVPGRRLTGWRKLAGASWRAPTDPQFFGSMQIDAAGLLDFAEAAREHTGAHLTITHLVGRAVAHGLQAVPALQVRLARGREYQRESLDVFFILTTEHGNELTGVKVASADQKSAIEICLELQGRRARIEAAEDPEFGRAKQLLQRLPGPLIRIGLRVSAWLTSDLNLDLSRFGLPRQAFGTAMVTSVGMWGVTSAYSPLAAYYRVPVLVLVGAVEPRPVARAGAVVVRPMITLTATFDHRYVDGFQAARFAEAMQRYCAAPAHFEPELPPRPPARYEPDSTASAISPQASRSRLPR